MNDSADLQAWFREYASMSRSSEPELLASCYAESFLAAGPKGSAAFHNNDQFLQWLRQVHAFNQDAGMQSLEVASVSESRISDDFTSATVEWETRFEKTGDTPIHFQITYILNLSTSGPRIVAYISHDDQEDLMKEYGLL